MPTPHTLSKGVTEDQFAAFEAARKKAGLTANQAKDRAFRMFCESQEVAWPETAQHGGLRPKPIRCPRCGEEAEPTDREATWLCECGLYSEIVDRCWVNYEIIDGQRIERDHKNTGW